MMRLVLCSLAGLSLWLGVAGCSGGTDLAGGSGAGNPGGPATFAIVADTGFAAQGLGKLRTPGAVGIAAQRDDGAPRLPIKDESDLLMTVSSANIRVQRIHFIVEDSDRDVLSSKSLQAPLYSDSESVILPGPFLFDLLTGLSEPSIEALHLPEADYVGVKLYISGGENCRGPNVSTEEECVSIGIGGTFEYLNSVRVFMIRLAADAAKFYRKAGPPILVSSTDTTRFLVRLDADRWLQGITLKTCLDNGFIPLDASGNLFIEQQTGSGSCKTTGANIWTNIIESGTFTDDPNKAPK